MPGEFNTGDGRTEGKAEVSKGRKVGRLLRSILPWVVTALIFIYIFRQVPFSDVKQAFKLVRLHLFIPFSIAVFLMYFIADSLVHHLSFTWLAARTRFFEVMLARGTSHILGMLNFFIGQGGIGYWLSRTKGVPIGEAASTIVFIMFMDLLVIMAVSSVGVVLMPDVHLGHFFSVGSEGTLVRVVFITLSVLLFQIFIWVVKPDAPLARRLLFRGPFQVFDRVRFRHFAIIFVVKCFDYIFGFFGTWLGLMSFGVEVPLVHVLTYLPLIYLIGAIPITVLHLGTTQAAWLFFFRDLVPPATVIAFSVLWSFVFIVLHMVVGLACMPRVLSDLKSTATEKSVMADKKEA